MHTELENITKESMRVVSCWNRKVSSAVCIWAWDGHRWCISGHIMKPAPAGTIPSGEGVTFARAFTPFAVFRRMHGD